jgi:hypothetical protein
LTIWEFFWQEIIRNKRIVKERKYIRKIYRVSVI